MSHPYRPLNRSWAILSLVLLLGSGSVSDAAEKSWIEIESVPINDENDEWVSADSFSGYTGDAYYAYTEGRNRSPRLEDALVYFIDFPVEGTYRIEYRGRRDRGAFQCDEDAASDRCNDMFTQLDDGPWYKTMMKRPQYGDDDGGSGSWSNWMWDGRLIKSDQNSQRTVTAGVHRLAICGRSPGIALDAIRIYLIDDEPATSDDPSWLVDQPDAASRVITVSVLPGYVWEVRANADLQQESDEGGYQRFELASTRVDIRLVPTATQNN